MFLGFDHVQLAFPPGSEARARVFHLGIEPDMRPSLNAHPALLVSDLDAWIARLVGSGAAWRVSDELPATRRRHTQDPFGNRIELIEGRADGG